MDDFEDFLNSIDDEAGVVSPPVSQPPVSSPPVSQETQQEVTPEVEQPKEVTPDIDSFEDFLNSLNIPQKVESFAENPSIPQETKEEVFKDTPMEKEVQQLNDGDERTTEVNNESAEDFFGDFLRDIEKKEHSIGKKLDSYIGKLDVPPEIKEKIKQATISSYTMPSEKTPAENMEDLADYIEEFGSKMSADEYDALVVRAMSMLGMDLKEDDSKTDVQQERFSDDPDLLVKRLRWKANWVKDESPHAMNEDDLQWLFNSKLIDEDSLERKVQEIYEKYSGRDEEIKNDSENEVGYTGVDFGDDIWFDDGRYSIDNLVEEEVKKEKEKKKSKLQIAPLHSSLWDDVGMKGKALGDGNGVKTVKGQTASLEPNKSSTSHVGTKKISPIGGGGSHSFGGYHSGSVPKRKSFAQHGGYGGTKYTGAERAETGSSTSTGMIETTRAVGSVSSSPSQKHTSFSAKRLALHGHGGHNMKGGAGKMAAKKSQTEDLKIRLLRDSVHWPTFKTGNGKEVKRTTKFTPLTVSAIDENILVGKHSLESATPEEEMILRRAI